MVICLLLVTSSGDALDEERFENQLEALLRSLDYSAAFQLWAKFCLNLHSTFINLLLPLFQPLFLLINDYCSSKIFL